MKSCSVLRRTFLATLCTLGLFAIHFFLWPISLKDSSVRRRLLQAPLGDSASVNAEQGTWTPLAAPLPENFATCLRTTSSSAAWQEVARKYATLPRLGIVVTTTANKANPGILHNLEAYAHRHGYGFHSSLISVEDWKVLEDGSELHHFFTARWHHLQQRLLGKYQWLLHVDGDVFALNMNRSLDDFLESREDILLHVREQYEVTASAVLLRSTPFSHCFLQQWIKLGTNFNSTRRNWDNGDLVQLVMDIAQPPITRCKELRGKYTHFVDCFKEHYDQLASLQSSLPVRILFPMAGFWRSFEGIRPAPGTSVQVQVHNRLFYTCAYPSDILGHGWKNFDSAWPEDVRQTVARNVHAIATPDACNEGLTEQDQLLLAKTCCFNHYPGCLSSQGENMCAQGEHCPQNLHHWHRNCTWVWPLLQHD